MDAGRIVVVLVGHGIPPKDYPYRKVAEYVELERRAEAGDQEAARRFEKLDREVRGYPRTPENDPYWYNMMLLAEKLKNVGGFMDVIPAFNEFCAPTIEEAVEKAAEKKPEGVIVVPTMIIRGGEHSEEDIPRKLEKVKRRIGGLKLIYAWPFDASEIAAFLASQVRKFI